MSLPDDTNCEANNDRKLIYLDQNFISAIAKVKLRQIKDERFSELYERLTTLLDDQKVIVPDSNFHHIESAWASKVLETKALEILKNLSRGVSVRDWRDILDMQLGRAVDRFFGEKAAPFCREEAFYETPQKLSTGLYFDCTVTTKIKELFTLSLKRRKALRKEFLGESPKQLPRETLKFFKTKRDNERRALVSDYFKQPCLKGHLSNYIIDAYRINSDSKKILERYREADLNFNYFGEFVDSSELRGVPLVDIVSSLNAAIIAYEGARRPQPGDFYDVLIVATILPYCDVLATDNFMKSLIVDRLELDEKYSVEVFSQKNDPVDKLLGYLDGLASL